MRKNGMVLFLLCVSFCLIAQKQGQPRIDSLLLQLPKAVADSNEVNLLNDLSFDYKAIDADEGIQYGQLALSLAEKLKWKKGMADADEMIGVNYYIGSDYSKALEYYEKALGIAKEINYKPGIADIIEHLSVIYNEQGDFPKAMEYDLNALRMNEELDNKNGIANTLYDIGNIYVDQNDIAKAMEYFNKALKMFEELNNNEGEANTLNDMGVAVSDIGSADNESDSKGLEYYNKAIEINEKLGYKRSIARNLGNIGEYYIAQKDYLKALQFAFKSLGIFEKLEDKRSIALDLGNIGEYYLYTAEDTGGKALPDSLRNKRAVLNTAINYLKQSNKINKEEGLLFYLESFSMNLSDAESLLGNYKDALESYKQHSLINDSIFSLTSNRKIASLETKQQADLKEKEIVILNKDKQIQVSEIKRQRLIRNSMLGAVGVAAIIALLLVRLFNRKRKNEFDKQVSEVEMKALRAQMNPHFIFNSLNSIHRFIQLNNSDDALEYLVKFSKLMRLILENSRYKEVALEKDLEALRLYMDLEAARMDNKFTYEIKTGGDLDVENTLIPPLILQPFVENAIWHGMMNKEGKGKITVCINKENEMISCVVEDNGVGREKAMQLKSSLPKEKHVSLGMKLTHDRINIINSIKKSKAYILLTDLYDEAKNPSGTKVEVKLPLELSF
jgi:tetratricopeptide (TPR) repeat protein